MRKTEVITELDRQSRKRKEGGTRVIRARSEAGQGEAGQDEAGQGEAGQGEAGQGEAGQGEAGV